MVVSPVYLRLLIVLPAILILACASSSLALTTCLRSGEAAERSYSTFRVRRGDLVQGKEQRLRFAGAAVKRYPTSKVRETQVRQ